MHRTYTIELAQARDIPRIAAMSREFIEQGLGWRWGPGAVQRCVRDRATNVAVARDVDGAPAGFGIMKYGVTDAHLLLFGVAPAQRRRGIGAALLAWLEASAVTAGIELVFLEARAGNVAAREFYRSRGYRELTVLRGYYRGQEDAVRLGKDLTEK
ncbi:GNAT family N-acetyltransferase [Tahibacter soli]|jgi:ribosomal-protein-alanine N-acetyltransferase|uniref:GNAT family N-acetyltransferase n=1 Tax=Tahibacter soli TaxID=2983605 RepID=A0A9X3YPI7_9GAMM|nr:GNAT family N-acetyltransferase [Tahibacter soli]MDC8015574.1 GNAT family N-acetyltransferase [Tahibacter soli]